MARTIDVHAHYFPWRVFKELGEKHPELKTDLTLQDEVLQLSVGALKYTGKVDPGILDIVKGVEAMNRQKIDLRILSPAPFSFFYNLGEQVGLELCERCNDAMASIADKSSGRIVGMAIVPLQSPSLAVEELRRSREELGLRIVTIGSNVNGRNIDDDFFRPFLREVARSRVPMFVHPASVAASERLRDYCLINLVGNPLDTTIAAASLIFGGVFEESPELKVILAHGGGFLPYQIGRFDRGFAARPEAGARISKLPYSYLRNLYFDVITHSEVALEFLLRQVGSDHVLLGSDYPFDMGYDDPVGFVKSLNLPDDIEGRILGGNAEKLLAT